MYVYLIWILFSGMSPWILPLVLDYLFHKQYSQLKAHTHITAITRSHLEKSKSRYSSKFSIQIYTWVSICNFLYSLYWLNCTVVSRFVLVTCTGHYTPWLTGKQNPPQLHLIISMGFHKYTLVAWPLTEMLVQVVHLCCSLLKGPGSHFY